VINEKVLTYMCFFLQNSVDVYVLGRVKSGTERNAVTERLRSVSAFGKMRACGGAGCRCDNG